MNSPLQFDRVSKSFQQKPALRSISLRLAEGRITGLIGPDGAGKTTLMRLACGLLRPDQGEIRRVEHISYMPQKFGLYEDLSVRQNLDLYADLQGLPASQRAERYALLMQMTGLAPFMDRLAGRLSGGMKQKLGLACTLLKPPQLLLLDEPTVGVDPLSRRELWQIISQQVEQGMSVLLSTAYLDEAERCDQIILLHEGQIIAQDAPQNLSHSLQGQVYFYACEQPRQQQKALLERQDIIDIGIEAGGLRLLVQKDAPIEPNWQPVPPRFEDAFIALLDRGVHEKALHELPHSNQGYIKVSNLMRRFGDFIAVDHISFEVRPGEIFGLLGANGAGKTTTFRMLCGLLPLSAGQVEVAGYDLHHAPAEARKRIGYMAQKFSLYQHLNVRQNLEFFAAAYGLQGEHQQQRIAWALQAFELKEVQNQSAGALPLGYQQRLAFATALIHQPDILFLDEPTSGVDPLARREFWRRTNALASAGVTILVTTHFMEEANYCDRLLIMSQGRILAQGSPQQILDQVRSPELPQPSMEDAFIQLIHSGGHFESHSA